MIKVSDVSKSFDGFPVLSQLSLNVKKGSIYGLVGPNGAGKTTIINHIIGVLKPDRGEITIDGKSIWENTDIKQKVINIADDWFYYSSYSVSETANFYKDMYKSFSMEKFDKIAEMLHINKKQQIRRMSKGMKRQIAFLTALSSNPDVLILDEPLDGLDPVMRKQILNLVISEVLEREMTVLVSSHNLRELEDICDYVGIIHKGKMILEKQLDDLKGNVCKYQAAFEEAPEEEEIKALGEILNISKSGSVYSIIARPTDELEEGFNALKPILFEKIALTLEEIFIYELGGLGYDFKNIL